MQDDLERLQEVEYSRFDGPLAREQRDEFVANFIDSAPTEAVAARRRNLVSSIESWSGADWENVRKKLRRAFKSGTRPDGDVGALFDAMNAMPANAPQLARGEPILRSQTARLEWLSKALTPGNRFDMDAASWTSRLDTAGDWAKGGDVNVVWELEPGSHAMNVEWASRLPREKEWIAAGRFQTVSAQRQRVINPLTGEEFTGVESWVIRVKEVGDVAKARPVWIPADWNPTHPSGMFRPRRES